MLQSTARSATTVSTSGAGDVEAERRTARRRTARTSPAGKSIEDLERRRRAAGTSAPTAARSVGAIASSGSHHACSVGDAGRCRSASSTLALQRRRATASSRPGSARGTSPLSSKIAVDLVVGDRVGDVDRRRARRRSSCRGWPARRGARRARGGRGTRAGRGRCSARRRSMTLRWNSSGSRKHGGPALGTTARAPIDST